MISHKLLIAALTLSLSACTGPSADITAVPIDPAATGQDAVAPLDSQVGTPEPSSNQAPSTGAEMAPVAILTLDREQMADADCHVMGETIMGKCDETDALAEALGGAEVVKVNTETMTDALCHYMNGEIMGQCSPDEIATLRYERTIVYDPASMPDQTCHALGNTIMGTCSPEEIKAQAAIIATSW